MAGGTRQLADCQVYKYILGHINGPERFNGDVCVERLSTGIDFDVPFSMNVPKFSFVSVI
jgi:hypothetical protein